MTYVITSACIDVKDRACVQECPVDCIYEGGNMLYINPEECVDCGACEPVCPSSAIYYEDDIPSNEKVFIEVNKDFFKPMGGYVGGSTGKDFTHLDHEHVLKIKGIE